LSPSSPSWTPPSRSIPLTLPARHTLRDRGLIAVTPVSNKPSQPRSREWLSRHPSLGYIYASERQGNDKKGKPPRPPKTHSQLQNKETPRLIRPRPAEHGATLPLRNPFLRSVPEGLLQGLTHAEQAEDAALRVARAHKLCRQRASPWRRSEEAHIGSPSPSTTPCLPFQRLGRRRPLAN